MRQTLILYARVESGHASRQKTGWMCDFCLPVGSNSGCAASKVEQNIQNFEKCSTAASKFGACGTESRQKTGETSDFCLPDSPNSGRAVLKVDKNGGNVWFLSTWLSKIGVRGLENRQKLGEMFDFCLPPAPKLGWAEPKVDKNRWECLIFVYLRLQNRPARPRK